MKINVYCNLVILVIFGICFLPKTTQNQVSFLKLLRDSKDCALALGKNCSGSALKGEGPVCGDDGRSPPRQFKNRCQMYAYNCIHNGDYKITNNSSCNKNNQTTLRTVIKTATEKSLSTPPIATESVFDGVAIESAFERPEDYLEWLNSGNARRAWSADQLRWFKTLRPNRHPGYKTQRDTATPRPGRIGMTVLGTLADGRVVAKYFYRYYAPEGRAKATNTYRHSRTTHRKTRIISKWTGWKRYHTAPTWWKLTKWSKTPYPWWLITSSRTVQRWEYVDRK